jgi:8-oxo-dGTP pyrophosphatase MutT (NUDIX family)
MAVVDGVAGPGIRLSGAVRQPAVVRDASTVVLLRDAVGGPGIEAYLLRRAAEMDVAGGMYAFPGGRVDPTDLGADLPWADPPSAQVLGVLAGDPSLARALVCAAVRETFEECGILLAAPASAEDEAAGAFRGPLATPTVRDAARAALERHERALSTFLLDHDLALRGDLLAPWARWVTPEVEPRRYDTRFFVAAMPPGQSPGQPNREASSMEWMRPADALARHATGSMRMLPPTAFTLAELGEYPNVASVLAAAHTRDLSPIMPKILVTGDEAHILLPHDDAYDDPGAAPPEGRRGEPA